MDSLYLHAEDLIALIASTLQKGATFRFKAKGFSMIPFIKNNDVVTISPLSKIPSLLGMPVAVIKPGSMIGTVSSPAIESRSHLKKGLLWLRHSLPLTMISIYPERSLPLRQAGVAEETKLAVHRIVGTYRDNYIVKGDNVFTIDGSIPINNILGYVSKVERNGKQVRLGLGRERFIIAALSRSNIICILLRCLEKIRSFYLGLNHA